MAKNDMEVIMYKILRYLYECMKEDLTPTKEDLIRDCDLVSIPEKYWIQIILELIDNELVKGIQTIVTKSGTLVQITDDVRVTFKGVEFLKENSSMKKVKEFLGRTYEIALSQTIESLLATH